MSKSFYGLAVLIVVLALAGCQPPPMATTITTIHPDGSFDREVTMSAPSGIEDRTRSSRIRSISHIFGFPAGRGRFVWLRPHENNSPSMVFRRHYGRGAGAVHDVLVKSGKGAVLVVNEAHVRPLADGKWVFTERYHWIGRPIAEKEFLDPWLRELAKHALGTSATTADIDQLSIRVVKDMLWVFDGPGDLKTKPMMSKTKDVESAIWAATGSLMRTQARSAAELAATERLMTLVQEEELRREKLSHVERGKVTVDEAPIYKLDSTNAGVNVRVRVPGTILATDGERTKVGIVEWTFVSGAVVVHDVVLRVEYRPDSK